MDWPGLVLDGWSEDKDSFESLPNCDVKWTKSADPVQHAYAFEAPPTRVEDAVHAVMVHGEAIVDSITMIPGKPIRILDQLSLWEKDFWINDRGLDPVTGNFIYGNHRGIPYCMERVTSIFKDFESRTWQRKVINDSLEWTMGPDYRTDEQYDSNMDQIGGPSTRMNLSGREQQKQ
eukprot:CAMPEP_0118701248 /NCGR_PEP_ID=MMETSP0800-20121206/17131_1 /TAXON_ID=210618 ORGANISM="Striatella unipunctata, Strain CCMP2910" /NCGR_SAMPLE_ID=MMETSP0800 /ASSEMBLY_ACC=CAM_ASM_000638 /LENGTH=175 /DNA_ID=CAMNT_0006602119 /DNA_START=410 /DNA_END=937 /DNA_ORIENTATION=-